MAASMGYSSSSSLTSLRVQNVWHVVDPLPIVANYKSDRHDRDKPVPCGIRVTSRSYIIRPTCESSKDLHAFFFGLSTGSSESMPISGVETIVRLMNNKAACHGKEGCRSPFSHATILDAVDDNYTMNIEGVCFHCHCDDKFSPDCWISAFSAAEQTSSLCKEMRVYTRR
ncbi:UL55 [Meleagrid alphaherpesvirus 1]|uniref:UL55 n=1 Tax=Meleagrid herpesvirus 1 TaxID=37108 RepID=Q9DH96_MEHV1|nr:nuclear protein UL55 [Meleagrid alphaherpesvirus 1]AKQ48641.1 nuclear protein UL55 [iBAC vector pMeHV1-C7]AKQ48713.1 nuclear protein UL55 [iBAC vector pMeHV1-C9]AKQ48785.1 nuclear protein UL55 [iBAC vector pMeHV1-C10]AKQ48857.1 nuclear protein UL55 [iBAC vector pMeHV1-C17]AKQ48930.1 nuclear protein UL55 [iBAC vector pMeHV1-C18]